MDINLNKKIELPRKSSMQLIIYIAILSVIINLFFNQFYDMSITGWHAQDFLDSIFHRRDFYSYALQKASNGGYYGNGASMDAAIYNPALYLLVGILILPIYIPVRLFSLPFNPDNYGEYLRLMMMIFSVLTAVKISTIDKSYNDKSNDAESSLLYLSSPVLFISVLVANQVDAVASFIFLIAYQFYLKDNKHKFSIIVGLAALVKPFPLIVFIPLILLAEKNILKLSVFLLEGFAPLGLITLICRISKGYNETQLIMGETYHFTSDLFSSHLTIGATKISLFVLAYFIVCLISFMLNASGNLYRFSLLVACLAYMAFFTFVPFHIQWFIHILPCLVLFTLTCKDTKKALLIESGIEACFMLVVCLVSTMKNHMLNSIIGRLPIADKVNLESLDIYYKIFGDVQIAFSLMVGFFLSFIILAVWDIYRNKQISDIKDSHLLLRLQITLIYALPPIVGFIYLAQ